MIDVERMTEDTRTASKPLVPPQLFSYWCRIFESAEYRPYVISSKRDGEIKETLSFVIIEKPFGRFLFSMPFIGYGCSFDRENIEDARAIVQALEELARKEDCLTMSIATHPLQSLDIGQVWDAPYRHRNHCQILELDRHPLEAMSGKRRKAVKNEMQYVLRRSNFTIDTDPDRETFDRWYEVYFKLCGEQRSVPQKKSLFEKYWEMSRDKIDFWTLGNEEEVVGGIFCARGRGIVDYNTSAFDSRYKDLCCTTYVLGEYFDRLISQGVRYFNMQSSKRFEDGTYRYKERWGAKLFWHDIVSKSLVDLENVTSIPLEKVMKELPGCYVLPYSLWEQKDKGPGEA